MERVWRRGRWLWPFFWLGSVVGAAVPGDRRRRAGDGGHPAWDRSHCTFGRRDFRFPTPPATVHEPDGIRRAAGASGRGDRPGGGARDRVGDSVRAAIDATPGCGRLGAEDGAVETTLAGLVAGERQSCRNGRCIGRRASIRIDFTVSHPFLGDVFGYVGTFTVTRMPRTGERWRRPDEPCSDERLAGIVRGYCAAAL